MLAAHGALGTVGAQRGQAQQGVQVEVAQGAGVGAQAQVALLDERAGEEGQADKEGGAQQGEGGAERVEPDDAQQGEQQLEAGAQQAHPQPGQEAQRAQVVGALGHVGGQAAAEIAVAQAGDLVEEGHAQAGLQAAAHALDGGADGELEQHQGGDEGQHRQGGQDALGGQGQALADADHALEEQGFDQHAQGGQEEGQGQHGGGEQAVLAQGFPDLLLGALGRLAQGGGQVGGEGGGRRLIGGQFFAGWF